MEKAYRAKVRAAIVRVLSERFEDKGIVRWYVNSLEREIAYAVHWYIDCMHHGRFGLHLSIDECYNYICTTRIYDAIQVQVGGFITHGYYASRLRIETEDSYNVRLIKYHINIFLYYTNKKDNTSELIRERAKYRCSLIKEELMQKLFHPDRVERFGQAWLDALD